MVDIARTARLSDTQWLAYWDNALAHPAPKTESPAQPGTKMQSPKLSLAHQGVAHVLMLETALRLGANESRGKIDGSVGLQMDGRADDLERPVTFTLEHHRWRLRAVRTPPFGLDVLSHGAQAVLEKVSWEFHVDGDGMACSQWLEARRQWEISDLMRLVGEERVGEKQAPCKANH